MVSWHLCGSVDATLTAVFAAKAERGGLVSSRVRSPKAELSTSSNANKLEPRNARGAHVCTYEAVSRNVVDQAVHCVERSPDR